MDLSRLVCQAAGALDHTNAELLEELRLAEGRLEGVFFGSSEDEWPEQVADVMSPVLAMLHQR